MPVPKTSGNLLNASHIKYNGQWEWIAKRESKESMLSACLDEMIVMTNKVIMEVISPSAHLPTHFCQLYYGILAMK